VDGRTLERVRTPAGGVRGKNQEEIALLALAEVVAARRARGEQSVAEIGRAEAAAAFATDPVCGMVVDTSGAITVTHGGRRLVFCSAECLQRFEDRPELFAERLEQLET
jgi:YHS domain-containing protein